MGEKKSNLGAVGWLVRVKEWERRRGRKGERGWQGHGYKGRRDEGQKDIAHNGHGGRRIRQPNASGLLLCLAQTFSVPSLIASLDPAFPTFSTSLSR